MKPVEQLKVKLFADGAVLADIAKLAQNPLIKGFTTNPTLMRKAGVSDYKAFALEALKIVPDRPFSLEVFSDEFDEMEKQALEIASWGANVYVKIPVTNTRGEFSGDLIRRLSQRGVQLNVTAMLTARQCGEVAKCLEPKVSSFISLFAGRVADTGRDPIPEVRKALELIKVAPRAELIWASPRELLNVFQADEVGCHILTATTDILAKLSLVGKDLEEYSLDTVKMFWKDAHAAGYKIETGS